MGLLLVGLAIAGYFAIGIFPDSTLVEPKEKQLAYENPRLAVEIRVEDLLGRMSLQEKVSQLVSNSPAIERLGIPKYNWWTEGLHGVKAPRAGVRPTVFPQAIGMAATWNTHLIERVADAIAEEARAIHYHYARAGRRSLGTGLSIWAPNVNIFRDPRWGRGQETFGEDPYLVSRFGVAFVKGLQGEDPDYLKVIATPKHFAVHSGPEAERHNFDAVVDERDLRETYLPAFRACVIEGKAYSVMCAYNRLNGQPCCGSEELLTGTLRTDWGFEGFVVADCAAVEDMFERHQVVATEEEAVGMAVRAGCDLACYWGVRPEWESAVQQGRLTEAEVDRALKRSLTARFRLGMFDPPEMVAYSQIPESAISSSAHQELALQTARESIVLLKNDAEFLPLAKTLRSIAVIGPNADDPRNALLGNYHGQPPHRITPLAGIRDAVGPDTRVSYTTGCLRVEVAADHVGPRATRIQRNIDEAIRLATEADVVILCLGLSTSDEGIDGSPGLEGEEMGLEVPGFSGGDRLDLQLPRSQRKLLAAVHSTGTPIVLVLINGSALAINQADEHCEAILETWYPGQEGGTAIAEVLFGDYNPGGRLPITFYKSVDDLPPFADYRMAGRTYRYFSGEVLYPFGHGLSYTRFAYSELTVEPLQIQAGENVSVGVAVRNVGSRPGDEVVQLYLTDVEADVPVPIRSLRGFRRLRLQPGETKRVVFSLTPRQMSLINSDMRRVVEPGLFEVSLGGKQPDVTASADADTTQVLTAVFGVHGEVLELE